MVFGVLLLLIQLQDVQKIHVGDFGKTDQADRFRLLLELELTKVGFTVTSADQADATLSGALDLRVYAEESVARATVTLKDRDGRSIWGGDFQPKFHWGGSDVLKIRAGDIAKDLSKAKKKK